MWKNIEKVATHDQVKSLSKPIPLAFSLSNFRLQLRHTIFHILLYYLGRLGRLRQFSCYYQILNFLRQRPSVLPHNFYTQCHSTLLLDNFSQQNATKEVQMLQTDIMCSQILLHTLFSMLYFLLVLANQRKERTG